MLWVVFGTVLCSGNTLNNVQRLLNTRQKPDLDEFRKELTTRIESPNEKTALDLLLKADSPILSHIGLPSKRLPGDNGETRRIGTSQLMPVYLLLQDLQNLQNLQMRDQIAENERIFNSGGKRRK
ncbi:uncharacterized protein [Amphiura filiformis]|uniref:uncharacterized protein n=1 Tax=Amphiura filiformis TaxID=82378 RepID=UPI003B22492F